jgi:hypothetical protein
MLMVNQLVGFGVGAGGASTAEYIGSYHASSGAIVWPSGTASGDYALIVAVGNSGVTCSGFSSVA